MRIICALYGFLCFSSLFSQSYFEVPQSLKWYYQSQHPKDSYAIDTLNGDTIKSYGWEYFRINNLGDTLEQLKRDQCLPEITCGHDRIELTGSYTKWYPDRTLAESGRYICNQKAEEWIYFYPNGQLKKYENYFRSNFDENSILRGFLQGAYKEYFENGNVKVSGSYKLIYRYTSYPSFNPDTYEDEEKCCMWLLESKKDGIWLTYNEKGKRTSKIRYFTDADRKRDIMELPDVLSKSEVNEIPLESMDGIVYRDFIKRRK